MDEQDTWDDPKYVKPADSLRPNMRDFADGYLPTVECPKPRIIEDRDVILKVTGSTICGSDLHLLHGALSSHMLQDIHADKHFQDLLLNSRKGTSSGMNSVERSTP